MKICSWCLTSFPARNWNKKYCSEKCRIAAVKEQLTRIRYDKRKCRQCSKEFFAHHKKQIYCSKNCREKTAARKYKFKTTFIWEVLNRDNFACQYCGRNPTQDKVKLEVDHIKPKDDGGDDEFNNLTTACRRCNSLKGNRPLRHEAEFRKRIHRDIPSQIQFYFDFYSGRNK